MITTKHSFKTNFFNTRIYATDTKDKDVKGICVHWKLTRLLLELFGSKEKFVELEVTDSTSGKQKIWHVNKNSWETWDKQHPSLPQSPGLDSATIAATVKATLPPVVTQTRAAATVVSTQPAQFPSSLAVEQPNPLSPPAPATSIQSIQSPVIVQSTARSAPAPAQPAPVVVQPNPLSPSAPATSTQSVEKPAPSPQPVLTPQQPPAVEQPNAPLLAPAAPAQLAPSPQPSVVAHQHALSPAPSAPAQPVLPLQQPSVVVQPAPLPAVAQTKAPSLAVEQPKASLPAPLVPSPQALQPAPAVPAQTQTLQPPAVEQPKESSPQPVLTPQQPLAVEQPNAPLPAPAAPAQLAPSPQSSVVAHQHALSPPPSAPAQPVLPPQQPSVVVQPAPLLAVEQPKASPAPSVPSPQQQSILLPPAPAASTQSVQSPAVAQPSARSAPAQTRASQPVTVAPAQSNSDAEIEQKQKDMMARYRFQNESELLDFLYSDMVISIPISNRIPSSKLADLAQQCKTGVYMIKLESINGDDRPPKQVEIGTLLGKNDATKDFGAQILMRYMLMTKEATAIVDGRGGNFWYLLDGRTKFPNEYKSESVVPMYPNTEEELLRKRSQQLGVKVLDSGMGRPIEAPVSAPQPLPVPQTKLSQSSLPPHPSQPQASQLAPTAPTQPTPSSQPSVVAQARAAATVAPARSVSSQKEPTVESGPRPSMVSGPAAVAPIPSDKFKDGCLKIGIASQLDAADQLIPLFKKLFEDSLAGKLAAMQTNPENRAITFEVEDCKGSGEYDVVFLLVHMTGRPLESVQEEWFKNAKNHLKNKNSLVVIGLKWARVTTQTIPDKHSEGFQRYINESKPWLEHKAWVQFLYDNNDHLVVDGPGDEVNSRNLAILKEVIKDNPMVKEWLDSKDPDKKT